MGEEEEGDHEEGEDDRRVLRETIHLLQKPEHKSQILRGGGQFKPGDPDKSGQLEDINRGERLLGKEGKHLLIRGNLGQIRS